MRVLYWVIYLTELGACTRPDVCTGLGAYTRPGTCTGLGACPRPGTCTGLGAHTGSGVPTGLGAYTGHWLISHIIWNVGSARFCLFKNLDN